MQIPVFDGSKIPLSHFIQGCMEAKVMLPTPAAQKILVRLLRGKLSGGSKMYFWVNLCNNRRINRKTEKSKCPCEKPIPVAGRIR